MTVRLLTRAVAALVALSVACGAPTPQGAAGTSTSAAPVAPTSGTGVAPAAPTSGASLTATGVAPPAQTNAAAATSAPLALAAPGAGGVSDEDISGDVVVFAASSLTDAFKGLASEFQKAHPRARAVFSFGGSSQLAIQLINGARADVFASADQDQMDVVQRGRVLSGPQQVFVRNRLMVIAPHDNPAYITSLQDLAKPGLKVIGAQASVPIGYYTAQLLKSASTSASATYGADFQQRVERNFVSREDTVRQIVAKIQLGEADAAVVYVTDVTPQIADQLVRIALPDDLQVTATYPIAVGNGRNPAGGEAFVAFVESPPAQAILARWGFLPPTEGV